MSHYPKLLDLDSVDREREAFWAWKWADENVDLAGLSPDWLKPLLLLAMQSPPWSIRFMLTLENLMSNLIFVN